MNLLILCWYNIKIAQKFRDEQKIYHNLISIEVQVLKKRQENLRTGLSESLVDHLCEKLTASLVLSCINLPTIWNTYHSVTIKKEVSDISVVLVSEEVMIQIL